MRAVSCDPLASAQGSCFALAGHALPSTDGLHGTYIMRTAQGFCLALALAVAPLAGPVARAQIAAPLSKSAFVLFEYDIKDPSTFQKVAADIRNSLHDFKGEFVMREKVESLFGGAPTNLSVISFPAVTDARAWLASPGLNGLRAERDKAAAVRAYLVEKLD